MRKWITFFLIILSNNLIYPRDNYSLEITLSDLTQNIEYYIGKSVNIYLQKYELKMLKLTATIGNRSRPLDEYKAWFEQKNALPISIQNNQPLVSFFGQQMGDEFRNYKIIDPSATNSITTFIFLRYDSTQARDNLSNSLEIRCCVRLGSSPADQLIISKFDLNIIISDNEQLLYDPLGNSSCSYRVPARDPVYDYKSMVTILYPDPEIAFFDVDHPEEMKTLEKIEELSEGITYGFIVRSPVASKEKICSDISYFKRDSTPPEIGQFSVHSESTAGAVELSWKGGYDNVSYISEYKIYRIIYEKKELIKTIPAESAKLKTKSDTLSDYSQTDLIPKNKVYEYILSAIDAAGNVKYINSGKVKITPCPEMLGWYDYKDSTNDIYYNKGLFNRVLINPALFSQGTYLVKYICTKDTTEFRKNVLSDRYNQSTWKDSSSHEFCLTDGPGKYFYSVILRDAAGVNYCIDESMVRSCYTDTTIPSAVRGLTAEPVRDSTRVGGGYFEIKWNDVTDEESGTRHYSIHRKVNDSPKGFEKLNLCLSFGETSYTDVFYHDSIKTVREYAVIVEDHVGNLSPFENSIVKTLVLLGPKIEWTTGVSSTSNEYETIYLDPDSYEATDSTEDNTDCRTRVLYMDNNHIMIGTLTERSVRLGENLVRIPMKKNESLQKTSFIKVNIGIRDKKNKILAWSNQLTRPITETVDIADNQTGIPKSNKIYQNYPNPFNGVTGISYDLSKRGFVNIQIHNLNSRRVKNLFNEPQEAGSHKVFWDGRDDSGNMLSSGMYFYQIKIYQGQHIVLKEIKKMIQVR